VGQMPHQFMVLKNALKFDQSPGVRYSRESATYFEVSEDEHP
jgi:hypothetical protein